MVLGNVGTQPVCYYCNKPGHLKKDCFKLQNDLAAGGRGRGNGRNGGRNNGGRNNGGRGIRLNAMDSTMDIEEIMRQGLAAVQNRQNQLSGGVAEGVKRVNFADENKGQSKN